jgi:hypothetical protein
MYLHASSATVSLSVNCPLPMVCNVCVEAKMQAICSLLVIDAQKSVQHSVSSHSQVILQSSIKGVTFCSVSAKL